MIGWENSFWVSSVKINIYIMLIIEADQRSLQRVKLIPYGMMKN
jgi:hypothetical protein